jgi:hypothetical protein
MKLRSKYHAVLLAPVLLSVPAYPMTGWSKWLQDKTKQAWQTWNNSTVGRYAQNNPGTVLTAAGATGAAAFLSYNALSTNQRALPEYTVEGTNSVKELSSEDAIISAHQYHDADHQALQPIYVANQPVIVADPAYDAQLAQEILNPEKIEHAPIAAPVVKPAAKPLPKIIHTSFTQAFGEPKVQDTSGWTFEKDPAYEAELAQEILTPKNIEHTPIAAPVVKPAAKPLPKIIHTSFTQAFGEPKVQDTSGWTFEKAPAYDAQLAQEILGGEKAIQPVQVNKNDRMLLDNTIIKTRVSRRDRAVKRTDNDQCNFVINKRPSSLDPMDTFLEEMRPVDAAPITVPVEQPVVVKQPMVALAPIVKQPVVPVIKPAPVAKQAVIATAAVAAASKAQEENPVLRELLKQDEHGNTLLHKAIFTGNQDEAKAIIAKLNTMSASEYSAVVYGKKNKNGHSVADLIKSKEGRDYRQWTGIVTYVPVRK